MSASGMLREEMVCANVCLGHSELQYGVATKLVSMIKALKGINNNLQAACACVFQHASFPCSPAQNQSDKENPLQMATVTSEPAAQEPVKNKIGLEPAF